jgi:hypothetical protein
VCSNFKVEDVSKKRKAALGNSVCKIPKAFFYAQNLMFYLNFGPLKKQIKGLLMHMNIPIYGVT